MKKVKFEVNGISFTVDEGTFFRMVEHFASNGNNIKTALNGKQSILTDNKNIPTVTEIEKHITSQEKWIHSLPTISQHFLGYVVKVGEDRTTYDNLWNKIDKARRRIKRKYPNLIWIKKRNGFRASVVYMIDNKNFK